MLQKRNCKAVDTGVNKSTQIFGIGTDNPQIAICGDFLTKPWLTTKEAALYLGISEGAIRNQVWRGQLTSYKRLGRLYINREELDRQIETSRRGGGF